jgi:hypothetical protein
MEHGSNATVPAHLTAARAKLARAKQKFDAVNDEIRAFLDSEPYGLVPVGPDTGTGEFDSQVHSLMSKHANLVGFVNIGPGIPTSELSGLQFVVHQTPSVDWGLDVGDIGVNARSSLDFLVYQLAIANGVPPGKCVRTQFPIFLNAADYRHGKRSHRERMLAGVAPKHKRFIDNLQPFQRGVQQARNDPLAILKALTDRDKHRDWVPVYAQLRDFKITATMPDGLSMEFDAEVGEPRIYDDGDRFRVPVVLTDDAKVETSGQPMTIAFSLDDRLISLHDVERILLHVSGILDNFERRINL